MGSGHSSNKLHCNRYLDGQGPPSLLKQATEEVNGKYRGLSGSQPEGRMTWEILHKDLPGFPDSNTLQIHYTFPGGVQTDDHPHPGQPFSGQQLCSFLPDNGEGRKVLKLLEKAFDEQLLFTITTNTKGEDIITSATIPLKARVDGGSSGGGYPDSDYLRTVRTLLKNQGIH